MWAELQTEIKGFFLPGNNKEWARSQLLRLHQGPRQRIDNFIAQFQALKLQSECPDKYAKDLLERAISRKILEQVYMQGLDRTMWVCLTQAVRTVGRAQELFLINMTTPTWYFGTNSYLTSSGTPLGSGAPMDIGAGPSIGRHALIEANLCITAYTRPFQMRENCCHAPNMFGTVNMERTIDLRLSWSER